MNNHGRRATVVNGHLTMNANNQRHQFIVHLLLQMSLLLCYPSLLCIYSGRGNNCIPRVIEEFRLENPVTIFQ
ncbi:hypothetical protein MARPO_0054s0119 [Marchantia polymorpha]|uniref:Uncharacterized protein n=1 Tax=Marchantia polymorpha TaxID=3197 RepID=A0A2R6WVY1_MARPO|nr:hypothetical protein MARPO_0054s0119 [Marchantia polymorpha]|eukprot:PTQ38018.1 hypothetical protein MARPO_0054s0119 [Marchantia polymorpha]